MRSPTWHDCDGGCATRAGPWPHSSLEPASSACSCATMAKTHSLLLHVGDAAHHHHHQQQYWNCDFGCHQCRWECWSRLVDLQQVSLLQVAAMHAGRTLSEDRLLAPTPRDPTRSSPSTSHRLVLARTGTDLLSQKTARPVQTQSGRVEK